MNHRLVALTGGLLSCLQVAGFASPDLQARLENSLKNARSLTNLEIVILDVSTYPPKPKEKDFSSTYEYTYTVSGGKFRATCKLVSATHTNSTKLSESAFNGTSFVNYNADIQMMSRQGKLADSSNSELPASPLIAPFMFLGKNSDSCPTCLLRFSDIVSPDFAKGVILPKGQPSNGLLHISVPGLPRGKKPTSWQIDIEQSGDSFTPGTVTRIFETGREVSYTLLNYTNVEGYQFPTTVKWVSSTYPPTSPPTVKSTGITTVTSVRILEYIPDSTFEIDEKLPAAIWDADRQKLTKTAPQLARKVSEWNAKRRVVAVILLLTVILFPMIAFKNHSRKSG